MVLRHSTLLDGRYIGTLLVKLNSHIIPSKHKMMQLRAFQKCAIDEKAGTVTDIIMGIAMLEEQHKRLQESHTLAILLQELQLHRCGRTYG